MSNPSGVYAVELLYAQQPEIDGARLLGALRGRLGLVEPIDGMDGSLGYVISELEADFADVRTSAQLIVTPTEVAYNPEVAAESLQQTWDWPGAADAVSRCTRGVFVSDFLARTLPPPVRLRFMVEAVRAVVGAATPLAIDWKPAQKVVDPGTGLTAPTLPFNVRFFTLADTGENVMDTRGLDILGLPDVQCRFTGLSPAEVASHLYGIAAHLVQQGPVRDGFIAAATDGQRWVCRYGESLAGPVRQIVDLQQDQDATPAAGIALGQGQAVAQVKAADRAAADKAAADKAVADKAVADKAAGQAPGGPAAAGQAAAGQAPAGQGAAGTQPGPAASGAAPADPQAPAGQVPAQDSAQVRSRQG
jgi:hypothetical protein